MAQITQTNQDINASFASSVTAQECFKNLMAQVEKFINDEMLFQSPEDSNLMISGQSKLDVNQILHNQAIFCSQLAGLEILQHCQDGNELDSLISIIPDQKFIERFFEDRTPKADQSSSWYRKNLVHKSKLVVQNLLKLKNNSKAAADAQKQLSACKKDYQQKLKQAHDDTAKAKLEYQEKLKKYQDQEKALKDDFSSTKAQIEKDMDLMKADLQQQKVKMEKEITQRLELINNNSKIDQGLVDQQLVDISQADQVEIDARENVITDLTNERDTLLNDVQARDTEITRLKGEVNSKSLDVFNTDNFSGIFNICLSLICAGLIAYTLFSLMTLDIKSNRFKKTLKGKNKSFTKAAYNPHIYDEENAEMLAKMDQEKSENLGHEQDDTSKENSDNEVESNSDQEATEDSKTSVENNASESK